MTSKNTAGQGMNEKGIGNLNTPNEHNTTKATSNPGRASTTTPPTSNYETTPPSPPSSTPTNPTTTTDHIKDAAKKTARKTRAKAHNAADSVGESVRHTAARAGVGYESTKEEVKHALNKGKAKVKAVARDSEATGFRDSNDTVFAQSRPSTTHGSSGQTPYTSGRVGDTAPPSAIPGVQLDAESMKAKARDTAASVKAGLSSVVQGVKAAASNVADTLKATTASASASASTMGSSTSERMAAFGERMEAKLEKVGENMMKSGEAIERRNREPSQPAYPEPLPLDEVDHMPNPKDSNDVLPGTGPKDSKRNEPITDSRERGQFPG